MSEKDSEEHITPENLTGAEGGADQGSTELIRTSFTEYEGIYASIVSRLHELELTNRKLFQDKKSLEHQLLHVLERVVSGGIQTGFDCEHNNVAMPRHEARELISETMKQLIAEQSIGNVKSADHIAPLAKLDYSGFCDSLLTSAGTDSHGEYSSLSDAFDDLCSTKDLIKRMITSESSHSSETELPEVEGRSRISMTYEASNISPKPPIKKISVDLIAHSKSFIPTAKKAANNIEQKESGRSVRYSTQYYKNLTDVRRISPAHLSSDISRPYRREESSDTESLPSSDDSFSYFSSSNSSSNSHQDMKRCKLPGLLPRYHTSVPNSPWSQTRRLPYTKKPESSPATREELIRQIRELYGLPLDGIRNQPMRTQANIPVGPPKVRIARKKLQRPIITEESSDTASTYSRNRLIKLWSDERRFKSSGKYYRTNHIKIDEEGKERICKSSDVKHRPFLGSPAETGREVLDKFDPTTNRSELNLPFLQHTVFFDMQLPRLPSDLIHSNHSPILQKMCKIITHLDAYTFCHGKLDLFQILPCKYASCFPITLDSDYSSKHAHESSDLTSELSNGTYNHPEPSHGARLPSPIKHPRITDIERMEIRDDTHGPRSCDLHITDEVTPIAVNSVNKQIEVNEATPVYQGVIYRLSSMKMWRRYHAVLLNTSLLFYTSVQSSSPPKRCICLREVISVRKPCSLSSSINAGLPGLTSRDTETKATDRIGSVPVIRKFGAQTDDYATRNNYGHFELLLSNRNTHRLRGATPTQTDLWMYHIQRRVRAVYATDLMQTLESRLIFQGWLRHVKNGEVSDVWCYLMGNYLIYTASPENPIPTGYKCLKGVQIKTLYDRYYIDNPHIQLGNADNKKQHNRLIPESSLLLTSSSDSDTLANGDAELRKRVIVLRRDSNSNPVYLICPTDNELEQWKEHLHNACHICTGPVDMNPSDLRSTFVQSWRNLVRSNYADDLYHCDSPLRSSLSKSVDTSLSETCTKMFSALLFLSYPEVTHTRVTQVNIRMPLSVILGSAQWLNVKRTLIHHLTILCFENPVLKDELFLQIIKQLHLTEEQNRRLSRRQFPQRSDRSSIPWLCRRKQSPLGSVTSSSTRIDPIKSSGHQIFELSHTQKTRLGPLADRIQTNSNLLSFPALSSVGSSRPEAWWPLIAVWEVLCLIIPLYLPSTSVLHCLELLLDIYSPEDHVSRPSSSFSTGITGELGKYATFCKQMINETVNSGGRTQIPSALELASISIRNPYTHKSPFSIPIHLPNQSMYEVVIFNGASKLTFIIEQVRNQLNLPTAGLKSSCMYAIYLRLPSSTRNERRLYVYLSPDWKICDILSLYEQSMLELSGSTTAAATLEDVTAEFVFRIQTFSWKHFKRLPAEEVSALVKLLVHQFHSDYVSGMYSVTMSGNDLVDLAAHMFQMDYNGYLDVQTHGQSNFGQLMNDSLPQTWLSTLANDGRSLIQLQLVLLDRWANLSKQFDQEGCSHHATGNQCASEGCPAVFKKRTKAGLSYLHKLKQKFAPRFATRTFAAFISNLSSYSEKQLMWLVPQDCQINILTIQHDPIHARKHSWTTIKSIPLNSVISFGSQMNGMVFLVYREYNAPISHDRHKHSSNRKYKLTGASSQLKYSPVSSSRRQQQQQNGCNSKSNQISETSYTKLEIYLTDLHSVIELIETLYFLISFNHNR